MSLDCYFTKLHPFSPSLRLKSSTIQHYLLKDLRITQMSLALSSLVTEVVTVIRVEHLHFTGTGYGKSLGGRLMRFDLTHVYNPFGCLVC